MLLDQLGPPGFRFNDFEAPRYPFITLYARADGQAVVCPLLRGSSPTRGVAPKQHRGRRVNLSCQPYARARRAATGRAACELWGLGARPPAIGIGRGAGSPSVGGTCTRWNGS